MAALLAVAGCTGLPAARTGPCASGVSVSADARQGVVYAEGEGLRPEARVRTTLAFGACT